MHGWSPRTGVVETETSPELVASQPSGIWELQILCEGCVLLKVETAIEVGHPASTSGFHTCTHSHKYVQKNKREKNLKQFLMLLEFPCSEVN